MENYPKNFLKWFRGRGLVKDSPLVTEPFTDGNGDEIEFTDADFINSYLIPMKVRDLVTMLTRVKKWEITVSLTATANAGAGSGTTQSRTETITTPDEVYRTVRAFYDYDGTDWEFPTTGTISNICRDEILSERTMNLEQNDWNGDSFPFYQIIATREYDSFQSEIFEANIGIGPRYNSDTAYYPKGSDSDPPVLTLKDCLKLSPSDDIYVPIDVSFSYFLNDLDNSYQASNNIRDISSDYPDPEEEASSLRIKFFGFDNDSNKAKMFWWAQESADDFEFTVKIEAKEYWTYGGKFDATTGEPT